MKTWQPDNVSDETTEAVCPCINKKEQIWKTDLSSPFLIFLIEHQSTARRLANRCSPRGSYSISIYLHTTVVFKSSYSTESVFKQSGERKSEHERNQVKLQFINITNKKATLANRLSMYIIRMPLDCTNSSSFIFHMERCIKYRIWKKLGKGLEKWPSFYQMDDRLVILQKSKYLMNEKETLSSEKKSVKFKITDCERKKFGEF